MIKPDTIIRSDRKTLSVCIDPLGRVTVRAPKRCDEERIFAFLKEKEGWIEKHKRKTAGACMRLPGENLDGFTFLLLGKECRVSLVERRNISFDAESYTLYLPQNNARERLVRWLKDNAKRILSAVTAQKAREMGVSYASVRITSAKTRWGSCSANNAVRYTFRLLYAPKEVIEYVVVHELSHTVQKDHSKAFWAVVARFVPDWKARRKWLKDNAVLMEIF